MKASIVIPNLNGAGWLEDSVRSCLAQTFTDFELIIIDNGSTDESLQIARNFAAENANCTLIENADNTGFSFAVNQGIRMAKGQYVVLFNNDAFAEPDWLAELIITADSDERIFSVASLMIRHFERELADDAGDYVNLLGWACKRGDGLYATRYQKQQRIFSACGGAALYRKSILNEIGLFDENFFAYLEDVDIGWRANTQGYINVFCPTAKCYHIASATTGSKYNSFKAKQGGRNNFLLTYKNMPLLQWVLNWPFLIVGDLIKIAFFYLRGFGKPYMQGRKEAYTLIGKLEKPPFKLKNIPQYLLIQWWLFIHLFTYADYRIRRALGWK